MHWLYRRHVDAAWQLSYRILRRRDTAQDCTQEAFIQAFTNLNRLQDKSRFSGWFIQIVHRKALDHLRREQRHPIRTLAEDEEQPGEDEDFLLRRRLTEAVETLNDELKSVFIAYDLLGQKHAEIAAIHGIAEGSSKRRLSEARAQLRVLLEDVAPK